MLAEEQIIRSIPYGRTEKRLAGFVFCLLVFLCNGLVFAAEQADKAGPPRYRVFPLKHITAEQGKGYLMQLGIGTVSQLPSPNTLLVTASARELIKAGAILELVDAEQQYVVKSIFAEFEAEDLPSNEKIASEAGDISIGTFSELPAKGPKARAIIDIHNGAVIAIAPAGEIEKIIAAIGRIRDKEIAALQPAEPNESNELSQLSQPKQPVEPNRPSELKSQEAAPAEPQKTPDSNESAQQAEAQQLESDKPDEFFGKLLEKLVEVEKIMAEPNEERVVVNVPEPNELTISAEESQQKEPAEPSIEGKEIEQPAEESQESKEAKTEDETATEETQAQAIAEPEAEEEVTETEEMAAVEEPTIQERLYEPEPIPIGEEELTLDLPEKLSIIDLLDLVGKYLNLDYMYDASKVRGEVTLKLQGPVKVRELYPLAESVLKFRNFVMTRKGNLVTIVPSGEVLDIDPTLMYDEKGKVKYGDVIVTRLFNLQYVDTASAKNLLSQMKLGANIMDIKDTGTLIVTDYAYRMGRVEELLQIMDRPGEPRHFRFRQLKYTTAKNLVPKVKTLVEQLGTISITVAQPAAPQPTRRGRMTPPTSAPKPQPAKPTVYLDADERTNRILMIGFENELAIVDELIDTLDVEQQDLRTLRLYDIQHVDAQEVRNKLQELGIIGGERGARPAPTKAAGPAAPAAAGEGLVEEPQVVIIESTNSLLVNATSEQHIQIATIISYVDSVTLAESIPYEIYPLENQNPTDLAAVLEQLIQETVKDKEGKIQQVIKREENIEIVPDESTFSLIVYASKKNQEWIRKLIKTLDRRRPQVLIDVTLVAIDEADAFDYDLQLISKLPEMVSGGAMQKLANPLLSTFPSNTVKEISSILGDASPAKGFYADSHIQALLSIMQKKGYGRVLAKPKILVNDNELGHIDTTNTIYVSRSSSSVTTTGEATLSTSYTFDQFPSGVQLDITPHISEGDLLRLEIKMQRSSQPAPEGGIQANQPPPDKSENNINTIVTVPDDSTIILGGIITLEQTKDNWKVPLLGDIPVVGGLFRKINNNSRQSKLYIFVKANILRPSETIAGLPDLERISSKNRAAFEGFEGKFQKYQDWPGVDPEPMDPLRVLEAE
jgi:type II secretory pathway component GspD/PulD (secretin)